MENLVNYLIGVDNTIQMILEYINNYIDEDMLDTLYCGECDIEECNKNDEGKHFDNGYYNIKNGGEIKFNGNVSRNKIQRILKILDEEDE